MKRLITLVFLTALVFPAVGQLDSYAHFYYNGRAIWYEQSIKNPGVNLEQWLMSRSCFRNYRQEKTRISVDMVEFIPKKGANLYFGFVTFTPDSVGYKVKVMNITYKLGADALFSMSSYPGFNGSNPEVKLEEFYARGGKFKRSSKLKNLSAAFDMLFDYKAKQELK
ncbi:MAG: hypothetical protein JST14_02260 [Bacteroidetes bacterium]|nr:hypothetical protein [Bacteroidota bacterium]